MSAKVGNSRGVIWAVSPHGGLQAVTLEGGLAQPTAISARAPLLGLLELPIRVAQVPVRTDKGVVHNVEKVLKVSRGEERNQR